jgi:hypothetical protein
MDNIIQELFGKFEHPRVHLAGHEGIIPILTIRPVEKYKDNKLWDEEFRKILKDNKIEISITYSISQFWPWYYYKFTTKQDLLNNHIQHKSNETIY